MERFDIDKIRQLPIESVAQRLGFTVNKHKCICPFHQDSHPSLTFNVRKNTYRCYVCDAHGGVIDLVMEHLKLSFVEACRWLDNENNTIISDYKVPTPYTKIPTPSVDIRHLSMLVAQPYLNEEAHRFLFDERKLHPAVVKWLGISSISSPVPMSSDYRSSWFNAPSLLIPYKDVEGKLLSVQARYLGNNSKPRFQFPRGSKCHIFNLPVLKLLKPGEELWISEGVSDCMALLSSGRKAIAIPSATLLKEEDVKLLSTFSSSFSLTKHIYPDQDEPGRKLYFELKERFPDLVYHQLPEGYKDFGQYWASR